MPRAFGRRRLNVGEQVRRRIAMKPSCFFPEITLEIMVPEDRDAEEFIDELLDTILCEEFRWNCEWDFAD